MNSCLARFNATVIFLCLSWLFPATLLSHSGGLNSSGCHTNHKTGDYHCHGTPRQSTTSQQATTSSYSSGRSINGGGLEVKPSEISTKKQEVKIVGVTDGDTLRVMIEGQELKIRLAEKAKRKSVTWG